MILNALALAFVILFIHACTWRGMILGRIRDIADELELPTFVRKPLYDCPVCMSPWWGTALYILFDYGELLSFQHNNTGTIVVTIMVSAGINVVFAVLITLKEMAEIVIERLEGESDIEYISVDEALEQAEERVQRLHRIKKAHK